MTAQPITNGLPPIHPGEYLREILDDMALTQSALADALGVSPMRISHLLKGDRPVTAELALRLGRAFGQTPQYWLNLQSNYDLKTTEAAMKESIQAVRTLAVA
ncbi:HigA family addiction module antitoxin [Rhodoferax bucti]|uniref:HigA family addiction module antitoxin n=1 Tax=Rhodoferax bucti TaxID=2576305 RepID=UPI001108A042|nr:HigA family addiction module antitoxin [Rhodoferax bucti]